MALFTIGDLHLSFSEDKPMDVFGEIWKNHPQKLLEGFRAVREDDLTVLCGDLSWALSLEGAKEDFAFIDRLPGRKLLLKGNHDFWWSTATKAYRFFEENNFHTMEILHNNAFVYENYALCGTRGWFYEEDQGTEHDRKLMQREISRLEASLKAGGDREKIVFLHYPPVFQNYRCEEILQLLQTYKVRRCFYGHIHGRGCALAYNGWIGCTEFRLVSADHLRFHPLRIIPEKDTENEIL
ncbi:MAG: metallophosphoesterase [Oscillospiraceae bacterium]|nr:metallophosphoesterase [Oscillospiraceae bacterium]